MDEKKVITLAHGSGGKEMDELISSFNFKERGSWTECDNDGALLSIECNSPLIFTTDSFVVNPIFFPGGNIGHLAFCGTVNDLLVMGAIPLGISIGLVLEEGFPLEDLNKIIGSIRKLSEEYQIPIVTGDTKVMEKGKIDKIIINTSGIGIAKKPLIEKITPEDKIILSGGLGEHAVALLSTRFKYETSIVTDSKPLLKEMESIRNLIKIAKDPTRGGIASILNDICRKNQVGILLDEESIPAKEEVRKVVDMLGINLYELACEGRVVCVVSKENADEVLEKLKEYNKDASIIGEIIEDNKVIIKTILGKRVLPTPVGRIIPRIC